MLRQPGNEWHRPLPVFKFDLRRLRTKPFITQYIATTKPLRMVLGRSGCSVGVVRAVVVGRGLVVVVGGTETGCVGV